MTGDIARPLLLFLLSHSTTYVLAHRPLPVRSLAAIAESDAARSVGKPAYSLNTVCVPLLCPINLNVVINFISTLTPVLSDQITKFTACL